MEAIINFLTDQADFRAFTLLLFVQLHKTGANKDVIDVSFLPKSLNNLFPRPRHREVI